MDIKQKQHLETDHPIFHTQSHLLRYNQRLKHLTWTVQQDLLNCFSYLVLHNQKLENPPCLERKKKKRLSLLGLTDAFCKILGKINLLLTTGLVIGFIFFFSVFHSGKNQYRARQRALEGLATPALGLALAQFYNMLKLGRISLLVLSKPMILNKQFLL